MSIEAALPLSNQSLETLIDLVEIKLSMIEVVDRDDAREMKSLERCLIELTSLKGTAPAAEAPRRRGRRPRALAYAH